MCMSRIDAGPRDRAADPLWARLSCAERDLNDCVAVGMQHHFCSSRVWLTVARDDAETCQQVRLDENNLSEFRIWLLIYDQHVADVEYFRWSYQFACRRRAERMGANGCVELLAQNQDLFLEKVLRRLDLQSLLAVACTCVSFRDAVRLGRVVLIVDAAHISNVQNERKRACAALRIPRLFEHKPREEWLLVGAAVERGAYASLAAACRHAINSAAVFRTSRMRWRAVARGAEFGGGGSRVTHSYRTLEHRLEDVVEAFATVELERAKLGLATRTPEGGARPRVGSDVERWCTWCVDATAVANRAFGYQQFQAFAEVSWKRPAADI